MVIREDLVIEFRFQALDGKLGIFEVDFNNGTMKQRLTGIMKEAATGKAVTT